MEQGSLSQNPFLLGEAITLVRSLRDYLMWQESQGWDGIPLSSQPNISFRQQPQALKPPPAISVAHPAPVHAQKNRNMREEKVSFSHVQGLSTSLSAALSPESAVSVAGPSKRHDSLKENPHGADLNALVVTPERRGFERTHDTTPQEGVLRPLQRSLLREVSERDYLLLQQQLDAIHAKLPPCRSCSPEGGSCQAEILGDGPLNARLMWIYEGPNVEEDRKGLPFQGKAGRLLEGMMRSIGLRREEAYITPILTCRPLLEDTDESWGKFNPTEEQIQDYVPTLHQKIQLLQPDLIITLGVVPAQILRKTKEKFRHLHGHLAHAVVGDREFKVFSMFHPSYLCRNPKAKPHAWADLQVLLRELQRMI